MLVGSVKLFGSGSSFQNLSFNSLVVMVQVVMMAACLEQEASREELAQDLQVTELNNISRVVQQKKESAPWIGWLLIIYCDRSLLFLPVCQHFPPLQSLTSPFGFGVVELCVWGFYMLPAPSPPLCPFLSRFSLNLYFLFYCASILVTAVRKCAKARNKLKSPPLFFESFSKGFKYSEIELTLIQILKTNKFDWFPVCYFRPRAFLWEAPAWLLSEDSASCTVINLSNLTTNIT